MNDFQKDYDKDCANGYNTQHCNHRKSGWCKACNEKLKPNEARRFVASLKVGFEIRGFDYLASPYTYQGRFPRLFGRVARYLNYLAVLDACSVLVKRGEVTFSPIVHSHPMAAKHGLNGSWSFWRKQDLAYLYACRRLVVLKLDGWEKSTGVQEEIEIALALGKPVVYIDPRSLTSHVVGS